MLRQLLPSMWLNPARRWNPSWRADLSALGMISPRLRGRIQATTVVVARSMANRPVFAGYSTLEMIGEGGFSQVYRAEADSAGGSSVAIKVFNPERFQPDQIEEARLRFVRGARAMQSLGDCPNIVKVFDVIEDDYRPAIVMEYLPLQGLADELRRRAGVLPSQEALQLTGQLAVAVEAAHAKGIVHRDITEANILCVKDESALSVRLADFDLCYADGLKPLTRITDDPFNPTRARTRVISKLARSEGFEAIIRDRDRLNDVVCVAGFLYCLLAGKAPPQNPTELSVGLRDLRRKLLADLDRSRASAVLALLQRAFDPSPIRRYGSIQELRTDLGAIIAGGPLKSRGGWKGRIGRAIFGLSWSDLPESYIVGTYATRLTSLAAFVPHLSAVAVLGRVRAIFYLPTVVAFVAIGEFAVRLTKMYRKSLQEVTTTDWERRRKRLSLALRLRQSLGAYLWLCVAAGVVALLSETGQAPRTREFSNIKAGLYYLTGVPDATPYVPIVQLPEFQVSTLVTDPVNSLAFSRGGEALVLGRSHRNIDVFDFKAHQMSRRAVNQNAAVVLAAHPTQPIVLTAGISDAIEFWNLSDVKVTRRLPLAPLFGPAALLPEKAKALYEVSSIQYAADGQHWAAALEEYSGTPTGRRWPRVFVWSDPETAPIWTTGAGDSSVGPLVMCAVAPWIAYAREDGSVTVESYEEPHGVAAFRDIGGVTALAFSTNCDRLIAGTSAGELHILDIFLQKEERRIAAHTGTINGVALLGQHDALVSAGQDGHLRNWRWSTLLARNMLSGTFESPDMSLDRDCGSALLALAVTPNGHGVAAGLGNGGVCLHHLGATKPKDTADVTVKAAALAADGHTLWTLDEKGIDTWDSATLAKISSWPVPKEWWLDKDQWKGDIHLAISSDGARGLLTAEKHKPIDLSRVDGRARQRDWPFVITAASFASGEALLGSAAGELFRWKLDDSAPVRAATLEESAIEAIGEVGTDVFVGLKSGRFFQLGPRGRGTPTLLGNGPRAVMGLVGSGPAGQLAVSTGALELPIGARTAILHDANSGNTVSIWDVTLQAEVQRVLLRGPPLQTDFAPQVGLVAIASRGKVSLRRIGAFTNSEAAEIDAGGLVGFDVARRSLLAFGPGLSRWSLSEILSTSMNLYFAGGSSWFVTFGSGEWDGTSDSAAGVLMKVGGSSYSRSDAEFRKRHNAGLLTDLVGRLTAPIDQDAPSPPLRSLWNTILWANEAGRSWLVDSALVRLVLFCERIDSDTHPIPECVKNATHSDPLPRSVRRRLASVAAAHELDERHNFVAALEAAEVAYALDGREAEAANLVEARFAAGRWDSCRELASQWQPQASGEIRLVLELYHFACDVGAGTRAGRTQAVSLAAKFRDRWNEGSVRWGFGGALTAAATKLPEGKREPIQEIMRIWQPPAP